MVNHSALDRELMRAKLSAFDLCVAIIIGEQNQLPAWDSPEYEVLQRVLQRVQKEIKELEKEALRV